MTVVQPKIWGTQDVVSMTGVDLDALATLPNGGSVVTFRQNQKVGFQIYDGNGDKVGGTHFVDAPIQTAQWQPDIVTYGTDGSFSITWTEAASSTAGGRVLRSQTFDIAGNAKGAAATLNSTTQYDGAQTTADGHESWATAYVEDVSGTKTLRVVERASDGTLGTPVSISTANGVNAPDIARIGDHKYVVSYLTTGVNSGFAFSVVDGGNVGAPMSVANAVAADVVALKNPDGTPTGEFVVVSDTGTAASSKITAQKYHLKADGTIESLGSTIDISTGTKPSAEDKVSVVALKDGGYAVAYVASTSDDTADIYVKVVDKDGNAGQAIKVEGEHGPQLAPAISEMADGRLSVSWHNPSAPTGGSTIETNIVDARAAAIHVDGTAGNDVYAPSAHTGDVLDGAGGINTLTFKGAGAGVSVNLAAETGYTGDAVGDTYKNFQNVIGSKFDDMLVGSAAANKLAGGEGNDVLDGAAGAGIDTLDGGNGNDTYYVHNSGDVVVENAGGGLDAVFTTVSYTLSAFVENLTAQGTDAIALTGNDQNNVLTGNDAANTLVGGAGHDTLVGGGGNDHLVGGAGDDVLNGGAGADDMDGGDGNDTYYVDNADDLVHDSGTSGVDTVVVSVNYDLNKLVGIENITGTGSAAITLTGNAGNNVLVGNDGPNILYGGAGNDILVGNGGNDRLHGGLGRDVLHGGGGRDTFVFDTNPKAKGNIDRIVDFRVQDDSIYLENKYFKVGAKGTLAKPAPLSSKMFYAGAHAHDADDRIVYDKKKGILWYDADGSGHGKAIEIATLSKNLKMTYHDFFVI